MGAFDLLRCFAHRIKSFLEVDELLQLVQQPDDADRTCEIQSFVLRFIGQRTCKNGEQKVGSELLSDADIELRPDSFKCDEVAILRILRVALREQKAVVDFAQFPPLIIEA